MEFVPVIVQLEDEIKTENTVARITQKNLKKTNKKKKPYGNDLKSFSYQLSELIKMKISFIFVSSLEDDNNEHHQESDEDSRNFKISKLDRYYFSSKAGLVAEV